MRKNSRERRTDLSGDSREVNHRQLFSHGFGLKTVVMIATTEEAERHGDALIIASCRGLDSSGGVFPLAMRFRAGSSEERGRLLQDLTAGSLFVAKGEYTFATGKSILTLHNPIYYPVSLHFSEKEIREVFRANGIGIVKR